jgi:hypothetical protein
MHRPDRPKVPAGIPIRPGRLRFGRNQCIPDETHVHSRKHLSDDIDHAHHGFLPPHGDEMPLSVCAADLAQSADPRESNAGLDMLDSLLHDFNRKDNHAVAVS